MLMWSWPMSCLQTSLEVFILCIVCNYPHDFHISPFLDAKNTTLCTCSASMCMLISNGSYAAFLVCHFVVVGLLVFFFLLKITALKRKTMVSCLIKEYQESKSYAEVPRGKKNKTKNKSKQHNYKELFQLFEVL